MEEDKLSSSQNHKKNQINDLSSDIEIRFAEDSLSDCTSMTSTNSFVDLNEFPSQSVCEKRAEIVFDAKKLYQGFVKICLKIKFEKLHNTHKGRDIPEKILFKESIRRGISENEWSNFVLRELQNPQKYSQYITSSNKKSKITKNIG